MTTETGWRYGMGSRLTFFTAVTLLALALGGCASAPTAKSLASKIPACFPHYFTGISVYAKAEVTCDIGATADGSAEATVWLATFATSHDERSWLVSIGEGSGPGLPAGGCIEGNGWAADILVTSQSDRAQVYRQAARATGGRIVSVGWCY